MDAPSERLKSARLAAGYPSAASAARAFGWSIPSYSHHENGTRSLRPEAAAKYAKAFKTSAEWLLFGKVRHGDADPPHQPNEGLSADEAQASFEDLVRIDGDYLRAIDGMLTHRLYARVLRSAAAGHHIGRPEDLVRLDKPELIVVAAMARASGLIDDQAFLRMGVVAAMERASALVPNQTLNLDCLLRDLALSIYDGPQPASGSALRGHLMGMADLSTLEAADELSKTD